MSKKFKNVDWVITSKNLHLIKAFKNDLEEKGFFCSYINSNGKCIVSESDSKSFAIIYHEKREKSFTLPEDYVKALEYCSQEEQKDIVFEDGKWYITENEQYLIRATGKTGNNNQVYYYEFYSSFGKITRNTDDWCSKEPCELKFKEATLKEVEKYLIKYAEQQGYFKKGVKFKNPNSLRNIISLKKDKVYLFGQFPIYCLGDGRGKSLYLDGKWAEIIKDEEIFIDESQQYKIEFSSSHILINGLTYSKHMVEAFYEAMKLGQIKSLNVGCNGQYKVDFEKIEKIYKKLTNGNN